MAEKRYGGENVDVNVPALKALLRDPYKRPPAIAKKIGLKNGDPTSIYRIMRTGRASSELLADIASALDVTLDTLIAKKEPPNELQPRLSQLLREIVELLGRDDAIKQVVEAITSGVNVNLCGMAGIGKTTCATAAAHKLANLFPDARLRVPLLGMTEPLTPAQIMSRIIHDFNPNELLPKKEVDLASRYLTVLAAKRALILLDDALDADQLQSVVCASQPTCFIVTSRRKLELKGFKSVELNLWTSDQSLSFLRSAIADLGAGKGTETELRSIAGLCGHLPLALHVAAVRLARKSMKVGDFIDQLQDESDRLAVLKGKSLETDVEAVLGLSARQLYAENPELAAQWHMLSVFPGDFPLRYASYILFGDKCFEQTQEVLDELQDLSLLQFDAANDPEKDGRYRLHDLFRPIARNLFPVQNESAGIQPWLDMAGARLAELVFAQLDGLNAMYEKNEADERSRALRIFDQELHSIRAGYEWIVANQETNSRAALLRLHFSESAPLLLNYRLPASERIFWSLNAVDEANKRCQNAEDEDKRECLRIHGHALLKLASAYSDAGAFEMASGFNNQAHGIGRAIGDYQLEQSGLNNEAGNLISLLSHRPPEGEEGIEIAKKAAHLAVEAAEMAEANNNERDMMGAILNAAMAFDRGGNDAGYQYFESKIIDYCNRNESDPHVRIQAFNLLASRELGRKQTTKAIEFSNLQLDLARVLGDREWEGLANDQLAIAHDYDGKRSEALAYLLQAKVAFEAIGSYRLERVLALLEEWNKSPTK